MLSEKTAEQIEFRRITLADKEAYEDALFSESGRGCEFSFANIYLWGRQNIAFLSGNILIFSQFSRRSVYPYPLGEGDKKAAIDAIIEDAAARGIPCRITGLTEEAVSALKSFYPERFRFHGDEGAFDYVYCIDDLADLKGKKYHSKRNHLARFEENNPDAKAEGITEENISLAKELADNWYAQKQRENPEGDYHMEKAALEKAFRDFSPLGLFGMIIRKGDKAIAFTMGSRLSPDTVDVHFEKAEAEIQGAYAAINCYFARYIREKFPAVKYLDREEDMGLEGLRKAKQSYRPHHMIEKKWACLLEEGYEY